MTRTIYYQRGAPSKYMNSPMRPRMFRRGWRKFRKHKYEVK